MRVHFSTVEEWLEELRHECTGSEGSFAIEDQIVRATYRYEQSKDITFLYSMSVVAGFVVRGKLVELKQPCGDVLNGAPPQPETNSQTKKYAEQIMVRIEQIVSTYQLALRRGVFEE
jgi:hypothetical protein